MSTRELQLWYKHAVPTGNAGALRTLSNKLDAFPPPIRCITRELTLFLLSTLDEDSLAEMDYDRNVRWL